MTQHIIFLGGNHPFNVQLADHNGSIYTAERMALINRITLKIIAKTGEAPVYVDSAEAVHAGVFDKASKAASGELTIDLGPLNLTVGRDPKAELKIYDPTYPLGRVFAQLDLKFTDEALTDLDVLADVFEVVKVESGGTSYTLPVATATVLGGIKVGLRMSIDAEGRLNADEQAGTLDIHAQTAKTTPVDADELTLWDSVSTALQKVTWANIKATLKTYFDTLYADISHTHTGVYAATDHNHSGTYLEAETDPVFSASPVASFDGTFINDYPAAAATLESAATYDATLSSDLTYSGKTDTVTVGGTIAFGDLLYHDRVSGTWLKAVGGATATAVQAKVMALGAATVGESLTVLRKGKVRNDAWTLPMDGTQSTLFVSTTVPGAFTGDTSTIAVDHWSQSIGEINTASSIFFRPGTYFQRAAA